MFEVFFWYEYRTAVAQSGCRPPVEACSLLQQDVLSGAPCTQMLSAGRVRIPVGPTPHPSPRLPSLIAHWTSREPTAAVHHGRFGSCFGHSKVLPAGDVATTFYKYDKKKLLGAGAYAKVYKATLQAPRKHGTAEDYAKVLNEDGTFRYEELYKSAVMIQGVPYALKVIDTSKCADMDDITREVSILHMLTHPNIMRLYEVFYEVRTVVLVTELVAGGELFDRIIEKGNYSEKDAANVMSQLCNALSYMHEKNIVHLDLKPENLLYAAPMPDETLKVADFGLARTIVKGKELKSVCGTPGYVAPEIISNRGCNSTAVDMWSVGVILYILLCGFPPFAESELTALFDSIRKARYDFPSPWWDSISPQAKSLVKKLLVLDVTKRLTAKQVLENAWVQSEAPSTAIPGAQAALKKYRANQRLRKAVNAIIATKRIERALAQIRSIPLDQDVLPHESTSDSM